MSIEPIIRIFEVEPARAFDLFVSQIGRWWPGATIGKTPRVDIVMQPYPGGRWFERDAAGVETNWGKVLEWQPPARVLLAWQLNCEFGYDPELITEVELTFSATPTGGTLIRFEHRNLEQFGAEAERHAEKLRGGWPTKLDGFITYAESQGLSECNTAAVLGPAAQSKPQEPQENIPAFVATAITN